MAPGHKAEEQRRVKERTRSPPTVQGLDPWPRRVTARDLENAFEEHQSRERIKHIQAQDYVQERQERDYNQMMSTKWDFDAIKQAAINDRDEEQARLMRMAQRRARQKAVVKTKEDHNADSQTMLTEESFVAMEQDETTKACGMWNAGVVDCGVEVNRTRETDE